MLPTTPAGNYRDESRPMTDADKARYAKRYPGKPIPDFHPLRQKAKKTKEQRCLQPGEVITVVADLKRKAKRSDLARRHLILFRLATSRGLRVSEICRLRVADVDLARLEIFIRVGKRGKPRIVPVWDRDTLDDLRDWLATCPADAYVLTTKNGTPLNRTDASKTYSKLCGVLNRPVAPSIHDGRHSFICNALHVKKSLTAVQRAAGHESIATTSKYVGELGHDRELMDMFG